MKFKVYILVVFLSIFPVLLQAQTYREYRHWELFGSDLLKIGTGSSTVETGVLNAVLSGHMANRGLVWVRADSICERDTMIVYVQGYKSGSPTAQYLDTLYLKMKPDSCAYGELSLTLGAGTGFVDNLRLKFQVLGGSSADSILFQASVILEYTSQPPVSNIHIMTLDTLSLSERIDAKADTSISLYLMPISFGKSAASSATITMQYDAQGKNTSATFGAVMPRAGKIVDVSANFDVTGVTTSGKVIARGFISNFSTVYGYAHTDSISITGIAAYRAYKNNIYSTFSAGDLLGAQIIWGSFVGTIANMNITLFVIFE